MTDADKTIFISYRRNVSSYIARAIFLDLRLHGYDVFMDVESIDSGTFDTIILNQIAARGHFLVILTPGTVERCAEPNDWLRTEIEYAIDKQRNIVPVLVNEFKFAGAEPYLTGKLSELQRYNGLTLYPDYFDEGMARLRNRFLKQPIYGGVLPAPRQEKSIVEQKIEEVASQPAPTEDQLTAEEYFSRGYAKGEAGDYEGAIADYTEAIRLNPQYALAYNNRGVARKNKGDLDGAIADYTEAIRLDPQYATAYSNRANARSEKGEYDSAIADSDEALRLKPQYASAYINRGIIQTNKGDYDGAIADLTEAIRLDPQAAYAYNSRGIARRKKDDLDGAIADYTEAIRLDPQYAFLACSNRGVARRNKGDYDGAIADYTEAIRLNPQYADAYANRGESHFASKQYELSLVDLRQASNLPVFNNTFPLSNFISGGLAVTHHALGQVDEAKRLWRTLAAQDTRYKDADWVKQELNWAEPLVEEARKLIAKL